MISSRCSPMWPTRAVGISSRTASSMPSPARSTGHDDDVAPRPGVPRPARAASATVAGMLGRSRVASAASSRLIRTAIRRKSSGGVARRAASRARRGRADARRGAPARATIHGDWTSRISRQTVGRNVPELRGSRAEGASDSWPVARSANAGRSADADRIPRSCCLRVCVLAIARGSSPAAQADGVPVSLDRQQRNRHHGRRRPARAHAAAPSRSTAATSSPSTRSRRSPRGSRPARPIDAAGAVVHAGARQHPHARADGALSAASPTTWR